MDVNASRDYDVAMSAETTPRPAAGPGLGFDPIAQARRQIQRERSRPALLEDAGARESPQHTVQAVLVNACFPGEIGG